MSDLVGTVFLASLVGSLHCLGMCGPFVAIYAAGSSRADGLSWLPHAAYNAGRLLTYMVLGASAGAVGSVVNLAGTPSNLPDIAALVAGVLIVAWGVLLLVQASSGAESFGGPVSTGPAGRVLAQVLPSLMRRPPTLRALVLGLSSTLLPCGWLYGFVATAGGTGHAASGAVVMAAFWLGTLPGILGAGLGLRRAAQVFGPRLGVVMPLFLIVLGLITLSGRALPGQDTPPSTGSIEQADDDCH